MSTVSDNKDYTEPLLSTNTTTDQDAQQPAANGNTKTLCYKHIIFLLLSLVWFYFIHTAVSYDTTICIYLQKYMTILDTYYLSLITYHLICIILDWLCVGANLLSVDIVNKMKTAGVVIFSIFGLFNVITVNYAYNMHDYCNGLSDVALAWLFMANSIATVLVVVFVVVMLYGSVYQLYKYI
jgi:hypothetical protein